MGYSYIGKVCKIINKDTLIISLEDGVVPNIDDKLKIFKKFIELPDFESEDKENIEIPLFLKETLTVIEIHEPYIIAQKFDDINLSYVNIFGDLFNSNHRNPLKLNVDDLQNENIDDTEANTINIGDRVFY